MTTMKKEDFDRLSNALEEMSSAIHYEKRRPLIKIDRDFLIGFYLIADTVAKALFLYKFFHVSLFN